LFSLLSFSSGSFTSIADPVLFCPSSFLPVLFFVQAQSHKAKANDNNIATIFFMTGRAFSVYGLISII